MPPLRRRSRPCCHQRGEMATGVRPNTHTCRHSRAQPLSVVISPPRCRRIGVRSGSSAEARLFPSFAQQRRRDGREEGITRRRAATALPGAASSIGARGQDRGNWARTPRGPRTERPWLWRVGGIRQQESRARAGLHVTGPCRVYLSLFWQQRDALVSAYCLQVASLAVVIDCESRARASLARRSVRVRRRPSFCGMRILRPGNREVQSLSATRTDTGFAQCGTNQCCFDQGLGNCVCIYLFRLPILY